MTLAHVLVAEWPRFYCGAFAVHLSGLHICIRGGSHIHTPGGIRVETEICDVLAYGIFDHFVEAISTTEREPGTRVSGNGSYTSAMTHDHTKPKGKPLTLVVMGVEVIVKVVGYQGG